MRHRREPRGHPPVPPEVLAARGQGAVQSGLPVGTIAPGAAPTIPGPPIHATSSSCVADGGLRGSAGVPSLVPATYGSPAPHAAPPAPQGLNSQTADTARDTQSTQLQTPSQHDAMDM